MDNVLPWWRGSASPRTAPPPKAHKQNRRGVSQSESRTVSQSRVQSRRARNWQLNSITVLCFMLLIKIRLFHSLLCSRKIVGIEVQPAGLRRGPPRWPRPSPPSGHSVARKFSFPRFCLQACFFSPVSPPHLPLVNSYSSYSSSVCGSTLGCSIGVHGWRFRHLFQR